MPSWDKMPGFNRAEYNAWFQRLIEKYAGLVAEVDCDDCAGIGTTECECCGNDTDCDTCGGSGKQRLYDFLDEARFMECRQWDELHMQTWANGDAIQVPDKYTTQAIAAYAHPLNGLLHAAQVATGEIQESSDVVPVLISIPDGGAA